MFPESLISEKYKTVQSFKLHFLQNSPLVQLNTSSSEYKEATLWKPFQLLRCILNPLAPELFFLILAHSVYKMWIIQEPNKLELWNKLHFEEKKKTESLKHV